jgi:putative Holliday junction resolvase
MDRIIGIDYGKKRVGVAVSDPLGIFASALETVPSANIIEYLKTYTQNNKVERFVVGYPMNLNGKPAECAQYVDIFLKHLAKHFPNIPVSLEDERFTSQIAMKAMIAGGVKKMDRREKGAVDKVRAAIILQSYLDKGRF